MTNVYNWIQQTEGSEYTFPVYGRTEDDGRGGEVYPIVGTETIPAREAAMPPLAQQWRTDWEVRMFKAKNRGQKFWSPRLRAPQSFIDTGIWPTDVPRPMGGN